VCCYPAGREAPRQEIRPPAPVLSCVAGSRARGAASTPWRGGRAAGRGGRRRRRRARRGRGEGRRTARRHGAAAEGNEAATLATFYTSALPKILGAPSPSPAAQNFRPAPRGRAKDFAPPSPKRRASRPTRRANPRCHRSAQAVQGEFDRFLTVYALVRLVHRLGAKLCANPLSNVYTPTTRPCRPFRP
jgi:hypothetical protein